jgi:hypothetical protein
MSFEQLRVPGLALGAIVVVATGVWLTRAGRPYGTGLVTAHKLVALAAVIVIGVMLYQASRVAPLSGMEITVAALAAVAVLGAFASGAVASAATATAPAWALWVHRTVPYLAVVASGASVWMMLGRG